MSNPQSSITTGAAPAVKARPAGTYRWDLTVALLSVWFIGGLYLDGWAHNNLLSNLESFFTPWHAVFYSGFTAIAAAHIGLMVVNRRRGYPWRLALPAGYDLSLAGSAIFAIGGFGDMIWHELFGIEGGLEALFSPTHLLLAAGIALIAAGPWRATARRHRLGGWRDYLPLLLSLTFLLAMFTFMTQTAYLFSAPWLVTQPAGGFTRDLNQMLAFLGSWLHSAILMGILLLALRRFRLPAGSISFVLLVNGMLMNVMLDEFASLPAFVMTGLLADVFYLRLKPAGDRPAALRQFAFLVPALLNGLYLFTITLSVNSYWSVHTLVGLPLLAGTVGLLVSYLVLPPVGHS